jgi:hypothetical protein
VRTRPEGADGLVAGPAARAGDANRNRSLPGALARAQFAAAGRFPDFAPRDARRLMSVMRSRGSVMRSRGRNADAGARLHQRWD